MQKKIIVLLYYFFIYSLAEPHGMWNLSSLTKDQTHTPCSGRVESTPLDCQGSSRKKILDQICRGNVKGYLKKFYVRKSSRWCTGKESTCQYRRCKRRGFSPWVGKISWRRKGQPTLVFLSGKC